MKEKNNENIEIIEPIKQLYLFGYDNHFNSFVNLYKKKTLPNTILLNGQKGSGKSTFTFHFINYLLSQNEENNYSAKSFTINANNISYKLVSNGTHPNFFLLNNKISEKNIKIDQVRNLLNFLSKSAYSKNMKIVMIDNAENLNLNSSNALLKALEEPKNNTFFFIIYNNDSLISETIKSRCIEFKFFFNQQTKKEIFKKIVKPYDLNLDLNNIHKNFIFDTPGNILKYCIIFNNSNINISNNKLSSISYLFDLYKDNKDSELLSLASIFIELYYNDLSYNNKKNINIYFSNKYKILNQINDMKKFNLDKKNILNSVYDILENEKQ